MRTSEPLVKRQSDQYHKPNQRPLKAQNSLSDFQDREAPSTSALRT